jgi:hypothetical protein
MNIESSTRITTYITLEDDDLKKLYAVTDWITDQDCVPEDEFNFAYLLYNRLRDILGYDY